MEKYSKVFNLILFQLGWFSSVYFGAQGEGFLGAGIMFGLVALQAVVFRFSFKKHCFLLLVMTVGTVLDSVLWAARAFDFVMPSEMPWPYPIWMSALWYGFASTVDSSLAWLKDRPLLCAAFGFFGGPLSYYGGSSFGGMVFPAGVYFSLFLIACSWMLASVGIFYFARRMKIVPASKEQ